jgi:putative membrane protein
MNLQAISASILYALIGVAIFCITFIAVDKLTPYNLWKELVENKNTALAIVVGFVGLGICVIIAAAIH